jgi:RNA recognition motif-containing protein
MDLRDAMSADGHDVTEVKIVMDRDTGRPRGFAFVEMATEEGATHIIEALNGRDLMGRPLNISEAREREGGRGGGGGGGGFRGGGGGGFGGGGGDRGGGRGGGGGRRERW